MTRALSCHLAGAGLQAAWFACEHALACPACVLLNDHTCSRALYTHTQPHSPNRGPRIILLEGLGTMQPVRCSKRAPQASDTIDNVKALPAASRPLGWSRLKG